MCALSQRSLLCRTSMIYIRYECFLLAPIFSIVILYKWFFMSKRLGYTVLYVQGYKDHPRQYQTISQQWLFNPSRMSCNIFTTTRFQEYLDGDAKMECNLRKRVEWDSSKQETNQGLITHLPLAWMSLMERAEMVILISQTKSLGPQECHMVKLRI